MDQASDAVQEALTSSWLYVRDRTDDGDRGRDEFGASNSALVTDEIADRFTIVGPPDEHIRRLRELSAAGVDQFNLYLMSGDDEAQLEAYGSTVIPALKAALRET